MFRSVFIMVLGCFFSLFGGGGASAMTITSTYTPGTKITLTGATVDTRFDAASPLFSSSFSGAYLDTTTRNFSGAFYIQNIGWALMSSGSYQVGLNCGVQSLSSLTTQCLLTGSGWAENIGEVGFANVRYNPSLGTLSGSITSFAGDFSVEGIALPLLPVTLNESLVNLSANHATPLSVKDAWRYGDGVWSFRIIPSKNTTYPKTFVGSSVGAFNIDLSLADSYIFEITDPQGSKTNISGVDVIAGALSETLDSVANPFIEQFCSYDQGKCPDIYPRTASSIARSSGPKVADGSDAYTFTVKLRDKYGNWIKTGNLEIAYTGSLRAVQLPNSLSTTNTTYFFGSLENPVSFTSPSFIVDNFSKKLSSSNLSASPNMTYTLSSPAPTNATNTLSMDSIRYNGATMNFSDIAQIDFDPAYTVGLTPPSPIVVGVQNKIEALFAPHTSESLSPKIIHLFSIGNGSLAGFYNLTSVPSGSPQDEDTDWMIGLANPSSLVLTSPSMNYTLSGVYTPVTPYPEPEDLNYFALIHYNVGGLDVIYPVASGTQSSELQASRVKILGQSNAPSEYSTITTSRRMRTDFFNSLRKNIALLSRNRTNYTDVNYDIRTADTHVGDNSFASKRTVIVVGKDITIDANISKKDAPLAIIALADKDGNGGNIHIAASVTEINAGLFAEHSVFSSGDNQLVVVGTIVSANTFGDTTAGICPYYITSCLDPAQYNLENLRTYDGADTTKQSSHLNGAKYPNVSLIIEYDMRLQSDPPPGIAK